MNLMTETLIISGIMISLCSVPLLSQQARRHSKLFFLLGTGALTGILFFELVPSVFEMGGQSSLVMMGIVWAVYSIAHLSHLGHHRGKRDSLAEIATHVTHPEREPTLVFLGSMMAHCFASGVLLVVSDQLNRGLANTVFIALVAHKGYEALTVSSILIEKQRSKWKSLLSITLYALSLPTGVLLTLVFHSSITQGVAITATSLAAGTLFGCLIFDFLLPSMAHVRSRKHDLGWIALGLLGTQLILWVI